MSPLNEPTEACLLPDDALRRLEAYGLSFVTIDHGVRLTAHESTHDLTVLTYTMPGTLTADRLAQARARGLPVLVTAPFVSTRLARRLAEEGIHYVDAAGNASIRLPGLVVEIHGHPRPAVPRVRDARVTGRRTGLKVLLTLLSEPDRAGDLTVREVADAAHVSLGSAQAVLADLREDRFLHDGGLDRTHTLFEAWLASYRDDLRLRRARIRFSHDPGWYRRPGTLEAVTAIGGALGGEDAAEHVGLPLRGTSGILYAPEAIGRVVAAARLRRDPTGTLELRDIWWRPQAGATTAPSPLIYADLVASEDPRQVTIAEQFRNSDALLRRLDAN